MLEEGMNDQQNNSLIHLKWSRETSATLAWASWRHRRKDNERGSSSGGWDLDGLLVLLLGHILVNSTHKIGKPP